MKSAGKSNSIPGKPRIFDSARFVSSHLERIRLFFNFGPNRFLQNRMELFSQKSQHYLEEIKSLGLTRTMDELERGKLRVFNQLNLFQFLTGIVVPLLSFFGNYKFPVS